MTDFFATAPRGFEELLAAELRDIGLASARVQRGGVRFTESLAGAYRACLWSRIANRVLLQVARFDAQDEQGLY